MKGSDYVADFLARKGVRAVFELSGGMITHLLDSIHRRGAIRIVSVHHEQAAAFAADAVGRVTGTPGVALATSGPGATNLLTGIGSCYFDSSPAVFLTGQVNRYEQKGERPIRQLGFQETDIVAMAKPVTKAAWTVRSPEELPESLERAFAVAASGRPGPVLVDVPMDVQRIEADFREESRPVVGEEGARQVEESQWSLLFEALGKAKRPLILAGGGVRASRARQHFRDLVRLLGIPVVNSLLAVDVLPFADPLRVGLIGSYGNRWANLTLGRSDCLLVLGSRLDVRQTGSETEAFKGDRPIFHVDCDAGEINNRVRGCVPVEADLREFLAAAIPRAAALGAWPSRGDWLAEIGALRSRWPDTGELEGIPGINPNDFMHQVSAAFTDAFGYVVDVGQHQMWAAQSLALSTGQQFLTSGGMGSMGFGLPAALGVAALDETRPVVVIAGDGGLQCNIQELQTVVRNRFPLKIVAVDNGCHGMVRQFQQSYFDGRYQSTLWGYSAPDFAAVARAYGLEARAVGDPQDVPVAIDWLRATGSAPALLHVKIDTFANAYPKIAFGRPITEMEPESAPLGQEGT